MRAYVPAVSSNQLKLAFKLLTSNNPAARSALFMAASGLFFAPLDRLLHWRESKIYSNVDTDSLKLILVTGPPRSGTTLVTQYLVNSLQVSYINNLTSLFPRSPVVANRWLKILARQRAGSYQAYYGRSHGLAGLNDGLHIWDRWLGVHRNDLPDALQTGSETSIRQFFSAWTNEFGSPCVNKVNRLIGSLDIVAPILPDAVFVYLYRDPVMLAQSLLIARDEIAGDTSMNYGLKHPDRCLDDPVEDVCRQVEYYRQLQAEHQAGPLRERIVFIGYEEFCADPSGLLRRLSSQLRINVETRESYDPELCFPASSTQRLPEEQLRRIQERIQVSANNFSLARDEKASW